MLEFKDLKSDAFKKQTTSMQLLYMFQDALRMVYQQYGERKRISPETCEVTLNDFVIRLRVYDLQDVSFPVYWFSAQSAVFRSIREKSRSLIKVEYKKCAPSFTEIVYHVWFDNGLPF